MQNGKLSNENSVKILFWSGTWWEGDLILISGGIFESSWTIEWRDECDLSRRKGTDRKISSKYGCSNFDYWQSHKEQNKREKEESFRGHKIYFLKNEVKNF